MTNNLAGTSPPRSSKHVLSGTHLPQPGREMGWLRGLEPPTTEPTELQPPSHPATQTRTHRITGTAVSRPIPALPVPAVSAGCHPAHHPSGGLPRQADTAGHSSMRSIRPGNSNARTGFTDIQFTAGYPRPAPVPDHAGREVQLQSIRHRQTGVSGCGKLFRCCLPARTCRPGRQSRRE